MKCIFNNEGCLFYYFTAVHPCHVSFIFIWINPFRLRSFALKYFNTNVMTHILLLDQQVGPKIVKLNVKVKSIIQSCGSSFCNSIAEDLEGLWNADCEIQSSSQQSIFTFKRIFTFQRHSSHQQISLLDIFFCLLITRAYSNRYKIILSKNYY